MKVFLVFLFLSLSSISTSQLGGYIGASHTSFYENSQFSVIQSVEFNFGAGGLCPTPAYYSFTISGNDILLDVAYSVLGVWPAFYCKRIDTFTLDIPPGVYNLSVCVEILNVDIDTQEPITTNAGCNIDSNLVLGNYEDVESIDNSIFTFLNPAASKISIYTLNNLKIHEIQLIDYQGKMVKIEAYNLSSIDVSLLSSGYYFLKFATNQGVLTRKIYISHL
ncbi:MAG: T9SS type A sorting domain-containing protein [Fluviicola sp.]|nr:T9SS type A sorting domain-containing protein [Fluviicola sp.]